MAIRVAALDRIFLVETSGIALEPLLPFLLEVEMINEFQLKFGTGPDVPSIPIPVTPITIFVGPNNSGKSKVLSEILRFSQAGNAHHSDVILEKLSFGGFSPDEAGAELARLESPHAPNDNRYPGNIIIQSSRGGRHYVDVQQLSAVFRNPSSNPEAFANSFLKHFVIKLDGPSRVGIVSEQPAGDLQKRPENTLQAVFGSHEKRTEIRRIIHDAFGMYFVVDPTKLGSLRIRFSVQAPSDDMEERNIHAAGVAFHSQATLIDTTSDGVKAFTGIVLELTSGDQRVLLIDEPEAFLHPSLATKLGYEVAHAAKNGNKRIFASTHSPQFVMGCIQSGVPINIVRLTYRSGVPTARLLPSDEILQLMRNPLLRSTGVLNGLFYEHVVVTESDADRAFYQEINERLLRFRPDWGIPNCLFLNSQGKHTLQTIMQPLRKLGIPAASVVDVDVLKDSGAQWAGILSGANIPQTSRDSLAALRTAVKKAIDDTGKNMKRDGGISILGDDPKQAAESLFKQMSEYGLFVVPSGELESWLKQLGARGHGPLWLIDIFTRMGENSASPDYVRPSSGDVWEFISRVKDWLLDANRLGIPA
jgi:ABC-type cobalamin/Fe3+-siderophores transport system ATPase subunit